MNARIMTIGFCDLPVGARFEFRGRRYEKVSAQFGRDEERNGNLFHPRTEVMPMQSAECRVKNERRTSPRPSPQRGEGEGRRARPEGWWLPKPEDRYQLGDHDEAVRAAAE